MLYTTSHFSKFHSFFNNENTSAETETKIDFFSSIWDDDHILKIDERTGNAEGVIQFSKESTLLRILLTFWGSRVCILKVVMFLMTNII